jgi:hypothetical protein
LLGRKITALTINHGAQSKHQAKTQKVNIMKVINCEVSKNYILDLGGVFIAFDAISDARSGNLSLAYEGRHKATIENHKVHSFTLALINAVGGAKKAVGF